MSAKARSASTACSMAFGTTAGYFRRHEVKQASDATRYPRAHDLRGVRFDANLAPETLTLTKTWPASKRRRAFRNSLVLALPLGIAPAAHAAGPLGEQGARITTSRYGIDLFQGPVLASARVTGLSGAVTAVGDGADAIPWNPAAVALRAPYSTTRADWELTGGLTLPSYVRHTDFDNNGKVGFTYDNFVWFMLGGLIQYQKLAFGVVASFQNYELGAPSTAVTLPDSGEAVQAVVIRLLRIEPVVGYAFLEEQLHVGVGLRLAAFYAIGRTQGTSFDPDKERLLLNSNAIGAEAGVLFTPRGLPFRLGAAVRSPATPTDSDPGRIPANPEGDHVVGNVYLPDHLELPWEVEAGVALQLWRRPFNLRWTDEDGVEPHESEPYRRMVKGYPEAPYRGARRMLRQRYAALPRERVLLSLSGALSGPVENAVGIESMLSQRVDRSGERTVVTVRAGAEAEVLPYWLVLRAGSYLEPTRFRDGSSRVHGTGGFDVRVLRSTILGLFPDDTLFRLSVAIDAARDYFGWGLGAGVFH
jgi:hypothetical protein